MSENVLITGASGLVGRRLTSLLMQKGYQISHLSRSGSKGPIRTYRWDVEKNQLDEEAILGKDSIIHLAGAGIADKKWTKGRKKEILESRTKSSDLLFNTLKNSSHHIKTFVSASAIGIYGYAGADECFSETSHHAHDFLAEVVQQWEDTVDKISTLGIRVVKIRIGILLSAEGGALAEMMKPIQWGVGSPLGSGDQYMSWIHMDDVCRIFLKSLEDGSMKGVFNAVSPNPVTNEELTRTMAKILRKPLWLPNVPAFALKLLLGEMADLVLKGSNVSADKILEAGFQFSFSDLESALENLLIKK